VRFEPFPIKIVAQLAVELHCEKVVQHPNEFAEKTRIQDKLYLQIDVVQVSF
jgi:hypothetical protein